jgi:hypothetical protein
MKRFTQHFRSPAMIVAMVALIASLGSNSWAQDAVTAPAAGVSKLLKGSKIKKNSIPGNRLKKNSVTGKQVKESKLGKVPKAANADNAVSATKANSADTATTATTANAVANGSIGAAALKDVKVRATQLDLADGTNNAATVNCDTGEKAIGGGARFVQFNPTGAAPDLTIVSSRPVAAGAPEPQVPTGETLTGWRAAATNATGATVTANFIIYALCLSG